MKRLLFIHHSTGGNLIHQGQLREILYAKTNELQFWDHGYNLNKYLLISILNIIGNKLTFHTGLSDANGKLTGKDFNIQLSNNNPGDFAKIFGENPKKDITLSKILEFDIIAFKNCFPATKIDTDEKLESYKNYYLGMGVYFSQYPEKVFIAFTPPPLRKEVSKPEYAKRAQVFAKWLTTEWEKPSNTYVFDFFSLLADDCGFLKQDYCSFLPIDSHPNKKANEEIAPVFVDFLINQLSLGYK